MTTIVSGNKNTGKTLKMQELYRELGKGDGFISRKVFKLDQHTGYEIVRLSTGESVLLACNYEFLPDGWNEENACGPYSFSAEGLEFADRVVDEVIAKKIKPVFIDEIGPLELSGGGFAQLLEKLIKKKRDLYIVVRTGCVEAVIKKFGIKKYRVIEVRLEEDSD